jgi:drug/metabolite transporter (DMT)-like permease
MISILAMYALLALVFVLSKDLLPIFDPFLMVMVRMGICSIIFGMYGFFNFSWHTLTLHYIRAMIIVGFFNVYVANISQLIGLQYIDSVNASLWYNSTPFIIAFLAFIVYRTKVSTMKIAALSLGWFGFVPLALAEGSYNGYYLYGVFFFLLSALSMAMSALILEKNTSVGSYPLSVTNSLSMGLGTLITLGHYVLFHHEKPFHTSVAWRYYGLLALVIALTYVCAGLYTYLVRRKGALLVNFAGFSMPIFAFMFELILGKTIHITWSMVSATLLIVTALYLFSYQDKNAT